MPAIDKLLKLLDEDNIAEALKDEQLAEIGKQICDNYKHDRASRKQWEDRGQEAIKFAKQITDPKTFPWAGASNVVVPLLTTATIIFASRVLPEIIKDNHIVKCAIFGADPDHTKEQRASRVSDHMSWQLLVESDVWESDADKLFHILPLIGVCFKKVYQDPITNKACIDLCNPEDIVVHHGAASLDKAERVSHRYFISRNRLIENIRAKYFRDIDLEENEADPSQADLWQTTLDHKEPESNSENKTFQWEIIEQHCWLDLDEDGYEEPYIVVVHKNSEQVLGIYPRFSKEEGIELNEDDDILRIVPRQHFVDYHFIPSPDGGFYSLGYGHILYPLLASINAILNQLINAGTLSTTACGLISDQLKMRNNSPVFKMGEFGRVAPGVNGNLSDSIYQFKFPEPSEVLMQLLGLIVDLTKEIAAINDVMTGQALPQNAPATSVMEIASQGQKPFGIVAKRVYRSLKKEFKLLYTLNRLYLNDKEYFNFGDDQRFIVKQDYEDNSLDIVPVADPNMSSEQAKQQQIMALLQLLQQPIIAPFVQMTNFVKEIFTALKIPEERIKELLVPPEVLQQQQSQQPPDPKMMEAQFKMAKLQSDSQSKQMELHQAEKDFQLKQFEIQQKYKLKEGETQERQMKMASDAHLKQAQVNNMDEKVRIEEKKADAALISAKAQVINAHKPSGS